MIGGKMIIKKKDRWKMAISCICLFVMMFYGALTPTEAYAQAPSAKIETMEYLPLGDAGGNVAIGRYQFNYTGNWNYFSTVAEDQQEYGVRRQPEILNGYTNSSKATLSDSYGGQRIIKAYLVWEMSKRYDPNDESSNHVRFIMQDGKTWKDIYPDYAYVDNRCFVNWNNYEPKYCAWCFFSDVTSIVQAYGYGDYYVANIPEYHPNPSQPAGGGINGCEWQLIVVEEGDSLPVRALTFKAGATYRFGDWDFDNYNGGYVYPNGNVYNENNYKKVDTAVTFDNGIKTKSSGNVTGQVLVGCIDDPGNPSYLNSTLYTQQSVGGAKTIISSGSYTNAGLCRNNVTFNNDTVSVNLSDISGGLGNNATVVGAELNNIFWNTQHYIGTAIDIAFPDFIANQTTTTNNSTSVTVTGNIQNVSQQANTGIYDGELVVNIDPALTVTSATAIVDGNKSITGVVSGNTVTFSGEAIKNIMKGNTITYTVECKPNGSGTGRYENSDSFSGKLRADGVDTNYWIDNACTSSSYALAKYKVTLNKGTGIKDVSGAGEYTYGQKVTINAELLPGYHWKDWTGSYNTAIQKYTFDMPAQNITLTANGEANEYTIHFNPNDGTEVTPIPDMTVRYDEEITLPDATDAYIKYTLDGVNVTQNILDGTIVLDENGVVMMMLDEETGAMMTPDGATVSADGIITKTNEDGSMTVTYPDGSVTIIYPDGNTVTISAEGIRTETNADGSKTVTYPDGNVVTVSPEGVRTEISADGSKKVIYPDGNVVRVNPDGTTVPSDDAVSETTRKTGVTGAEGVTDDTATGTTGESPESTKATAGTENTENTEATESTEKIASIERNAVSRVTTAADGSSDAGADAVGDDVSAQANLADDLDAEPKPDKKAYVSVFMGWSLEEEKDTFVPQWKAEEPLKVSDLIDLAGMTDTNGATITLYAVWDDCPWIVADNLYYTLAQAQSGFITQEEILSHASASDREDGSPIASGVHENGTSFTIPDYLPTDFTQFQHEGSITENLTVIDSIGNVYRKQITVYIVDTAAVAVEPEGTTRFIDEHYYHQSYENGGLEEDSLWKTDSEYAAALQYAFENLRNETPVEAYAFSHEEILEMKQFIAERGVSNMLNEELLRQFYHQFCAANRE